MYDALAYAPAGGGGGEGPGLRRKPWQVSTDSLQSSAAGGELDDGLDPTREAQWCAGLPYPTLCATYTHTNATDAKWQLPALLAAIIGSW
jgi:hypothetical protein